MNRATPNLVCSCSIITKFCRCRGICNSIGANRRHKWRFAVSIGAALRWINYLSPNVKKDNFTEQEEDLIIRLHKLLGNRWSLIAKRVPGRTDNQVKNHWNAHLCKKLVGDYSSTVKTTIDDDSSPLLFITATASSRPHQQDNICNKTTKSFDGIVSAPYSNKPQADLAQNDVVMTTTNDPSHCYNSNALWVHEDEFELSSLVMMMDFASGGDIGYCL